ncbi:hypothetical protein Tco_1185594 [Tanacetum coccineum]
MISFRKDLMLTRYLLKSFKRKREMYTIKQRTKFFHDTIAAQRRSCWRQKHLIEDKGFDEIQVLYEKIKRRRRKLEKEKLGKRKKMKSKKRKFTSKDDEELRLCLTCFDEDRMDYEILGKKSLF